MQQITIFNPTYTYLNKRQWKQKGKGETPLASENVGNPYRLKYICKIRSAKPLGALTDTNCSGSNVAEQGILMYGSNGGGGGKTTRTLVPVL